MKLKMIKHAMTRLCQPSEQPLLESAGWQLVKPNESAGEEIIRLKPPVKSKATAKRALEEATNTQGDE